MLYAIKERRTKMHKSSAFLFLSIILLCVSCGPNLSNDEAKEIIARELDYPKMISTSISFWNSKDQPGHHKEMLNYLIKNGDLTYSHTRDSIKYYKPTEQGKAHIKSEARETSNRIQFDCAYAQEFITDIEETLIDEKDNTALVKYNVKSEPFEPYYSQVYAKSHEGGAHNIEFGKIKEKEITLKKYDKGWRILN
jgi:hypothetical protein